MEKKRICFVVETPYQILVSISILSSVDKSSVDADLYIGTVFQNAESIANRIIETKLFKNVYLYNPYLYKKAKFLKKAGIMLNPRKKLKTVLKHDFNDMNFDYDEVYFSTILVPAEAIVNLNKNIRVFWIDDGMESYIGDTPDPMSFHRMYTPLFVLAGLNPKRLYPEAVYLMNPSFCDKHPFCDDIREVSIPDSDEWINAIKSIFEYRKTDVYPSPSVVYLTNPDDFGLNSNNRTSLLSVQEVLSDVCNSKEMTLIRRKHPRELSNDTPISVDFTEDNTNNMWEMLCRYEISDQHILVALFSTAQFTPCMLFGKEPWIIFLYEIAQNGISEEIRNNMNNVVNTLKQHYNSPEKIIVPTTIDELRLYLNKIGNNSVRNSINE